MALIGTQLPLRLTVDEPAVYTLAAVEEEDSCTCGCSKCEDPMAYHGHCGNLHRGCHFEAGSIDTLQSQFRQPQPAH